MFFVESLADKWSRCIFGFWVESHGKRQGVATGFYALSNSRIFLVTARHSIERHQKSYVYIANRDDQFQLNCIPWHTSREDDLACVPCDVISVNRNDVYTCTPIPLDACGDPASDYRALLGFPASKNKPTATESYMNAYCVGIERASISCSAATAISDPIFYRFDRNSCMDGNLQDVVAPLPRGMSGGPILARTETGKVFLESVLVEYGERDMLAVGASRKALVALIERANEKFPSTRS